MQILWGWLNKKNVTNQVVNLTKSATNVVISDIKKAKYSKRGEGWGLGAGKSLTGWIFILCGAGVGTFFCLLILIGLMGDESAPYAEICLIGTVAGGCLGQYLHEKIKNRL